LSRPAYRKRLLRKLNTLIAVLEVACAKVRRSWKAPIRTSSASPRIHKNLKDTLSVCQKAKGALQRQEQLPAGLPPLLGLEGGAEHFGAPKPVLRPPAEALKFSELAPITADEIRAVDLEDLCRRLLFADRGQPALRSSPAERTRSVARSASRRPPGRRPGSGRGGLRATTDAASPSSRASSAPGRPRCGPRRAPSGLSRS
jgi:hypothetical protein